MLLRLLWLMQMVFCFQLERLCDHSTASHCSVGDQNNDVVSIFASALSTYTVYHLPIPTTTTDHIGKGVAVLIDQSIHDSVIVWHVSEQIEAIWLKCAGQEISNVTGYVAFLGAVYLNPKTDKRSNSDITESFEHLTRPLLLLLNLLTS